MSNQQPAKMWSGRFREALDYTFEQWQRGVSRWARHALVVLGTCGFLACSSHAQFKCPQDHQTAATPRTFTIEYRAMSIPIGAILLVRHGNAIGAIHVTDVQQDPTTKPRNTEWIGTISVETFYRNDDKKALDAIDTTKDTGKLTWGRYKGVGFHYSWQPGNRSALIGPWRFQISYLSSRILIDMSPFSRWDGDAKDKGFDFAPTSACDISELNIHDPQLKWYPFNNGNSKIELPLDKLAGRKDQFSGTKE